MVVVRRASDEAEIASATFFSRKNQEKSSGPFYFLVKVILYSAEIITFALSHLRLFFIRKYNLRLWMMMKRVFFLAPASDSYLCDTKASRKKNGSISSREP